MNTITITGRLARTPHFDQTTGGTPVTELRIALDDERGGPTSFVPVTCYGRLAETAARYLNTGRLVGVTGRLVVEQWTTLDDQRSSRTHVVARSIDFSDRRPTDPHGEQPAGEDGEYGPDEEPF
jgi:single-strand DNA-binding protein